MGEVNKSLPSKHDATKYIRKKKRHFFRFGDNAGRHIDKHFIERLQNLAHSWRFVVSWLLLGVLLVWVLAIETRGLATHYTQAVPKGGGIYTEGVVGPLNNLNPIYASTPADKAASELLFAGLMQLDENNQLVGDLAESIVPDDKASVYTVRLRDGLVWHDGVALTSQDVVYTVETIQNSAARSPLRRSLEGIRVDAVDVSTIRFTLPASFSPFPSLLRFGILPKHILSSFSPSQLRSVAFNSSEPIGSGPFKFQRIVTEGVDIDEREFKVQMIANEDYHFGKPRLDGFTLWVSPSQERVTEIFNDGQLSGADGIVESEITADDLAPQKAVFNQSSGVFLFFKTTSEDLQDAALRQALTKAVDVTAVDSVLDSPVKRLRGPLLAEQTDYTAETEAIRYNYDAAAAELDTLGWILGENGFRSKDGRELAFTITTEEGVKTYEEIVVALQEEYAKIGIRITADFRSSDGFSESVLKDHVYEDMLLYGINIGADPDVYAFWHSSQADENSTIRLNLSEYSSEVADQALEAGRSRVDPVIRDARYRDFLEAWRNDAPAIALYRPTYEYFNLRNVNGPTGSVLNSPSDRYRDVHTWTTLIDRVRYFEEN